MKDHLLTEQQAAAYLKMSRSWLSKTRMAQHPRRPPYIKIGKSIRYDIEDLDKWVKENTHYGADPDKPDEVEWSKRRNLIMKEFGDEDV